MTQHQTLERSFLTFISSCFFIASVYGVILGFGKIGLEGAIFLTLFFILSIIMPYFLSLDWNVYVDDDAVVLKRPFQKKVHNPPLKHIYVKPLGAISFLLFVYIIKVDGRKYHIKIIPHKLVDFFRIRRSAKNLEERIKSEVSLFEEE